MTCRSCAATVSEEIREIPGVTDVDVDLVTGSVTIDSSEPVQIADVQRAVEEAGYQLAG